MNPLTFRWVTPDPDHRTSATLVSHSDGSSWSDWAECLTEGSVIDLCRFQGHESARFRVKLCSDPSPLSRTFYTPTFTVYQSSKRVLLSQISAFYFGFICEIIVGF